MPIKKKHLPVKKVEPKKVAKPEAKPKGKTLVEVFAEEEKKKPVVAHEPAPEPEPVVEPAPVVPEPPRVIVQSHTVVRS